jgi:hypothetical protein
MEVFWFPQIFRVGYYHREHRSQVTGHIVSVSAFRADDVQRLSIHNGQIGGTTSQGALMAVLFQVQKQYFGWGIAVNVRKMQKRQLLRQKMKKKHWNIHKIKLSVSNQYG